MGLDTTVRNLIAEEVQRQVQLQLAQEMLRLGITHPVDERFTMEEAAKYAGVEVGSLRRWKKQGLRVEGSGRRARIARSALDSFMASGGKGGVPPPGSRASAGVDANRSAADQAAEIVASILAQGARPKKGE